MTETHVKSPLDVPVKLIGDNWPGRSLIVNREVNKSQYMKSG
jgi:hypothetical protein